MLTTYGVENAGFRVEQKADILSATPPLIAQAGGEFVVVDTIDSEQTRYLWNGKSVSVSTDEFFKIWSGIVLMAQPNAQSVEPDYLRHKHKENIYKGKKIIAIITLAIFFLTIFTATKVYANTGLLLLLLLSMAGIYVSYLLFLKHLHVRGGYGDKICLLFKQADCNNILESDATSLFGIISWSEIGLGYFISNTVIILFFSHMITWLAFINIFTLPYSFWSIWYQGAKANQWCPLCQMVQALLWLVFFVNLSVGFIRLPAFELLPVAIVACVYLIPVLIIHLLAPLITNKKRLVEITQEMNSIKANEKVFVTLLQEQPRYEVSTDYSHILLGAASANLLITVLTNPHCNPCANMHKRIEKLLKKQPNIQMQYIFSSFSRELEISARYLIAVYLQKSAKEREHIYSEWFAKGKLNKEAFFEIYPVDMDDADVSSEFIRHQSWLKVSQLRTTPTILVNGYKLPDNYKIENMKYFTDLEFEI